MTTTESAPTFPRNHEHCLDRTGVNYVPCTSLTHCPSICDCPVSACTAVPANPNRPTPASYCYNCDTAPCCWVGYRTDTVLENQAGTCKTSPRPITLREYEIQHARELIEALTDSQRQDALQLLSYFEPDAFSTALKQVTR